jgi:hypothetical protein
MLFFKTKNILQNSVYLLLDFIVKYRIDGEKIDDNWKFSDGESITHFYWNPGEPHTEAQYDSIGLKVKYGGKWDNIVSDALHGCICEKTYGIGRTGLITFI